MKPILGYAQNKKPVTSPTIGTDRLQDASKRLHTNNRGRSPWMCKQVSQHKPRRGYTRITADGVRGYANR
ncbi:MAG: hypothetical protein PHC48_05370 [Prevotella sp.]|nr:hypothetical protein [Prevotella sp.]